MVLDAHRMCCKPLNKTRFMNVIHRSFALANLSQKLLMFYHRLVVLEGGFLRWFDPRLAKFLLVCLFASWVGIWTWNSSLMTVRFKDCLAGIAYSAHAGKGAIWLFWSVDRLWTLIQTYCLLVILHNYSLSLLTSVRQMLLCWVHVSNFQI